MCGNPNHQFKFDTTKRRCHATWAIANARDGEKDTPETRSMVWGARLSEAVELVHPDLDALEASPPTYLDS